MLMNQIVYNQWPVAYAGETCREWEIIELLKLKCKKIKYDYNSLIFISVSVLHWFNASHLIILKTNLVVSSCALILGNSTDVVLTVVLDILA